MSTLPPHNQRRLNAAIARQNLGYRDWYHLATEMREQGATVEQIAERFAEIGVKVHTSTVWTWLRRRDRRDTTKSSPLPCADCS